MILLKNNSKLSDIMMSTLNWHSLKAIKVNDIRLTISWATDGNNKIVCSRIDIRLFVNDYPTSYGVNLKRWELIHLGKFIDDKLKGTAPQQKIFDELTIESSCDGILLLKRKSRLYIKNRDLSPIEMFIPGIAYIAALMRPETFAGCLTIDRSIEDAFIYSTLVKNEIKSIDEAWKEEELISNGKLSNENIKFLKQNCMKMFDFYANNFGEMILPPGPCSRNDFLLRVNGEFIKSLRELYNDCPSLLRSLTLVMKSIGEYK